MARDRRSSGWPRPLAWCVAFCATLFATGMPAAADVMSDQAAAILVFPRVVVDTTGVVTTGQRVDTLIRVSNTSNQPISMRCFYVNATPQCTSDPTKSCLTTPSQCTPISACQTQWQETDFLVQITAQQPIAWLASRGSTLCQTSDDPTLPCLPLSLQPGSKHVGPLGQGNDGSLIPGVAQDPFIGELKCVAVDLNSVPVERNSLKGEAEIVRFTPTNPDPVDVESYNAIGIPAIPGTNNGDNTLVLGGQGAEYTSCPNLLILDHFFDGADDPVLRTPVTTDLTFVPCSEDFATQTTVTTTVQFLVFNEFEQRLSTSRRITCFQEFKLSDIDLASPGRSIFSAAVQGTLTGQTRMLGVADMDTTHGHTILGIAEEFRQGAGSAAFNLHFDGTRPQSDFIYLP